MLRRGYTPQSDESRKGTNGKFVDTARRARCRYPRGKHRAAESCQAKQTPESGCPPKSKILRNPDHHLHRGRSSAPVVEITNRALHFEIITIHSGAWSTVYGWSLATRERTDVSARSCDLERRDTCVKVSDRSHEFTRRSNGNRFSRFKGRASLAETESIYLFLCDGFTRRTRQADEARNCKGSVCTERFENRSLFSARRESAGSPIDGAILCRARDRTFGSIRRARNERRKRASDAARRQRRGSVRRRPVPVRFLTETPLKVSVNYSRATRERLRVGKLVRTCNRTTHLFCPSLRLPCCCPGTSFRRPCFPIQVIQKCGGSHAAYSNRTPLFDCHRCNARSSRSRVTTQLSPKCIDPRNDETEPTRRTVRAAVFTVTPNFLLTVASRTRSTRDSKQRETSNTQARRLRSHPRGSRRSLEKSVRRVGAASRN